MNTRYRSNFLSDIEDRRVERGFERGGIPPLEGFSFEVDDEQVFFLDQGQTNAGRDEKKVRVRDARAYMAEAFDQTFLR